MPMDALYWNSISFGSEESLTQPTTSRDYIDPWDLENYAYIREQLNSTELSSEASSSEYPLESNIYYVTPGVMNTKRVDSMTTSGNYAAIDVREDMLPKDRIKLDRRNSGKCICLLYLMVSLLKFHYL